MKEKIDKTLIINLVQEGFSYKEIIDITKYNKNTVYTFCLKTFGKLLDRNRSRRQSIEITQEQSEVIFGQLLGDGNLRKIKNSYQGRINHSEKQEVYCRYKQNLLKNLTYTPKKTVTILKNKEYQKIYYCMKPNENLKIFYNMFYNNNVKDVPNDLSLLTPKALAIWFMDDGSASGRCSISIATCSFSKKELEKLQKYLLVKYELKTTIQKDKKLYFSAESARKFYKIVQPFMIKEMLYKFKYVIPSVGH